MKRMVSMSILMICVAAAAAVEDESVLLVSVDDEPLITYQAAPLANPLGGDAFRGSNFIHPLKTPSGFSVTGIQPSDHLHHFGLWWPWKYVEIQGRKVLCWELQKGDGIVQAEASRLTPDGFSAESVYIDREAPDGPQILLRETVNARTSPILDQPARGYHLDLEIIHETAVDEPLTVLKYRYSGFTLRGTSEWDKKTSTVLTSIGKEYDASNFTRAKWVRVEGRAGEGKTAGILMMSRPDNFDHPELLRTWNPRMESGAVFVNFNPVQERSWVFEPGQQYIRRYRVFVYDGTLSAAAAEALWQEYAGTKPE